MVIAWDVPGKNLITHSVSLLHRFSSCLKDSRRKDYLEEIVLKLELKDLKLDQWVLVVKFMTF